MQMGRSIVSPMYMNDERPGAENKNDEYFYARWVGKRGSYILEAAMVIPALIIAVLLLIQVIPLIAAAENSLFAMGDEMKVAGIKAAYIQEGVSLPVLVNSRVSRENPVVDSAYVVRSGYLYSSDGIDDLISLRIRLKFSRRNPLGLFSYLRVEQGVMARGFTGAIRNGEPGITQEESEIVYVFPARGERYHNRSCSFLNPACQKVFLTSGVKSKFSSCEICKSGRASLGDQVFCFFTDGKVFHLGDCPQVDKYYIEMEKHEAIEKGYSACGSCGG